MKNVNGKTLYAVACEYIVKKSGYAPKVIPEIVYVHAYSEGEARWIFCQDSEHKKARIVVVGPAVGFFVDDAHGEQLTA